MSNKQKTENENSKDKIYYVLSFIAVLIIAILFTFPLYWIITGAFKTGKEINAAAPVWFPTEWVVDNFSRLMGKRTAPILGWERKYYHRCSNYSGSIKMAVKYSIHVCSFHVINLYYFSYGRLCIGQEKIFW